MTALTADRNTPARSGDLLLLTVYGIAATTIYAGSLVCVTSDGLAVPGGHAQAVRAIGRAEETVVNPLGGALTVTVRRGVFRFANQGADGYDVGRLVAVVDDQTISTLIAGDVVAGRLLEANSNEAWVEVGHAWQLPVANNTAVLTGTLTGTTDGVMADVAAAAGACAGGSAPTAANVDTAIATAVAPIVTGTNTQLKELMTKLNTLISIIKSAGLIVPD